MKSHPANQKLCVFICLYNDVFAHSGFRLTLTSCRFVFSNEQDTTSTIFCRKNCAESLFKAEIDLGFEK